MKGVHKRDFANLDVRIAHIKEQLDITQTDLLSNALNEQLHIQEFANIASLKNFLAVEESSYKQKFRIQWLKLGDSSNHFFFHSMKERFATNSINVLYYANGIKLTRTADILNEVMKFYKGLLDSAATTLPRVDIPTIRN